METDYDVKIDHTAYYKIHMHAIKHSFDDVCGILIGKVNEENGKTKYSITNSLPLFHTHILSPFLNLAFTLVENYYNDKEEKIIGYYHISSDDSLNDDIKNIRICELIYNKLIKNCNNAIICIVHFSKLDIKNHENNKDNNNNNNNNNIDNDEKSFKVFTKNNSSDWIPLKIVISYEKKKEMLSFISKENKYLNIKDFDDHLSCIDCDFMNTNLLKTT